MARTLVARLDYPGHLTTHYVQRRRRQRGVQFVLCQQFDAAFKILAQHLKREFGSGTLARTDRIQRLLERYAVELLAAVGQQQIQDLRYPLATRGRLQLGSIPDIAIDAHRIADVVGLNDQRQAVGKRGDDRVRGQVRYREAIQIRLRPARQLGRLGLPEAGVLRRAKPAARSDRSARTARDHHGRHGVVEIQVLARDAIYVGHSDFLDSRQVVVGRVQAVQRNGIGPDGRRTGDRILLELGFAALVQFGGLDELGRY